MTDDERQAKLADIAEHLNQAEIALRGAQTAIEDVDHVEKDLGLTITQLYQVDAAHIAVERVQRFIEGLQP